jgi:hypothetical protein
MEDWTTQITLK